MAQNRLGTALDVLTQRRQHPVTRVAVGIVSDVSQSVGMQARPLCDDRKPSILELCPNLF
jgi:hypothetical protein